MTGVEIVLVAAAGAVGATVRAEATTRARTALQGVVVVNTVGAFTLGLASVLLGPAALRVVGGGLLGALTTFSTWLVLADDEPRWRALLVPLAIGVVAATLGRLLGGLL